MKKKLLRWLVCISGAIALLVVAGILLIDTIAKSVAESRIRAETGMDASIGKFTVGLRSSTIHIENFVLKNPAEFGGETFIEIPDLFIEYNRDALRSDKLRLKLVRISINKIHVVENKEGKKNVDELQKHQAKSVKDASPNEKGRTDWKLAFDGVETLDVTIRTAMFTSLKNPEQNIEHDLGIRHEIFKNLKTDKDFQTAAALLALKAGGALLLNGEIPNLKTLLMGGSKAGEETKIILKELTEPLHKQETQTEAPR